MYAIDINSSAYYCLVKQKGAVNIIKLNNLHDKYNSNAKHSYDNKKIANSRDPLS